MNAGELPVVAREELVGRVIVSMVEPPDGSVVLDRDGYAWQRLDTSRWFGSWSRSFDVAPLEWELLVAQRGPVRVIFEGGQGS